MFFLSDMLNKKVNLPSAEEALPGRSEAIATADRHFVNDRPLHGPLPEGMKEVFFGMGCFWGVERLFWQAPGVFVTAAGYAGGHTPNPTYHETCTGLTGHAEVVKVVYDPGEISLGQLLKLFWEGHDPTQGMRQGNDVGSVYRSIILATDSEQFEAAKASRDAYQASLNAAGKNRITTDIVMAGNFYYAEEVHQQYLAKNPDGYCGLQGTGVACATPSPVSAA